MATTKLPSVSERQLSQALDRFIAALGVDKVLADDESVREYRDPFQHATWNDYVPSYVLQPTTVEEIQEIVGIANECRVPLWTISQGRNNCYGGPAPRVNGSVTISLRNMNRVLEINEECAYAVVEPGVRWFDLHDALRAGGHKLWLSCADAGWGSVIGNSLDNGITYLPYGQDFTAPCGMEIVLANGDLMRTGMGAMPGNKAWHVYKRGLGPTLDPLFTQSNYGIVTKMGVWLLPQPECYMPCWLRVWKDDDIGPVIDTYRRLMLDRVIEGVPQVNNTLGWAGVFSKRADWYQGEDPIPDAIIDEIARKLELGRWMSRFALYGDEEIVDHKFAKIKEAFGRIPGAEVWGAKRDPQAVDELEHPAEQVQAGVPNLAINQLVAWYGGDEGGHVGFSPVVPLTAQDTIAVRDLLRGVIEKEAGLDYMGFALLINPRASVFVTLIFFDTKDEAQTRRAYDTSKLLVREAAKHGYGEYRAHLDFMDLASDQYSFGGHAYRRFCETIKDAVDPNGILSPGRHGIWPRGMREGGDGSVGA